MYYRVDYGLTMMLVSSFVYLYVQLQATNEEGSGKWSDVVCFRTLPDRPQAPPKPQLKGKLTSNNFRVVWGMLIVLRVSFYLVLSEC